MGGQLSPTTNTITGQVAIVTGSSGGIGFEIAKELAARSARVVLACKDMTKAETAVAAIKKAHPNATVECRYLDLRSFDCVRRFVRGISADFRRVDVLINNAGMIFNANEKTVDRFEMHLQVNYLAPFLLATLLRPQMKATTGGSDDDDGDHVVGGRVIWTAAHAYSAAKMADDDPLNRGAWATAYHHRDAFAHSKLAVVLCTREMAKEFKGIAYFIKIDFKAIRLYLKKGYSSLARSCS